VKREKTRVGGGSPEEFQGKSDKLRPLADAYIARGNASAKYRRYRELELDFDKVFEGSDGDYEEWMEKHGKEFEKLARDPEVRAILDERAAVAKQFGNSLAVLRVMKYPNDPEAWKAVAMDDESYKEAQYRRLAGEVEARNAQARMKMTEGEKRRRLLSETENVAEDEKIYLERQLSGKIGKGRLEFRPGGGEAEQCGGAEAGSEEA